MANLENVSFDLICRVCLTQNKDVSFVHEIKLFCDVMKRKVSVVDMMEKYTQIKITSADSKPQKMCGGCVTTLCQSYNFFEQCVESDKLLTKALEEKANAASDSDPFADDNQTDDQSDDDEDYVDNENECADKYVDVKLEETDSIFDSCPLCDKSFKNIARHLRVTHMLEIKENRCLKCNVKKKSKDDLMEHVKTEEHNNLACINCRKEFDSIKACYQHQKNCIDSSKEIKHETEFSCKGCFKSFALFKEIYVHFNDEHKTETSCMMQGCKNNKEYGNSRMLQYHIQVQHGKKIGCRNCYLAFENTDEFEEHCKTNEHKNVCDICNRRLKDKAAYNFHRRSHTEKKFHCDQCPATYLRKLNLQRHIERDHEGHRFLCQECGKSYSLKHHLIQHIKTAHGDVKKQQCKKCGIISYGTEAIEEHMKLHENGENVCLKCKKTFESEEEFKTHIETHKQVKCEACEESFMYKVQLYNHMRIAHTDLKTADGKTKSLTVSPRTHRKRRTPTTGNYTKCTQCSKNFDNSHDYFMHVKEHKDYVCNFCEKSFKNKYLYRHHVKTHTEGFKHVCPHCGRGFSTKISLELHVRVHTGAKPFLCNICGKSFRQHSHLKYHLRGHSDVRMYKCQYCEKTFVHYSAWQCHERIHTGEKPYFCSVCRKGFYSSSTMKKHELTHTKVTHLQ